MTTEQREIAFIDENMIRNSVDLESADDAIYALENVLKKFQSNE